MPTCSYLLYMHVNLTPWGEFLFFEYLAGMLSNVHHDVLVSLVSAVFGAIFQLWCNMPIFTSFVKLPVYELIASAMYLSIQCFSTSGKP